MKESYEIIADSRMIFFEFVSEGEKGPVVKQVKYEKIDPAGIYNLSFGDKDHTSGEVDDNVVTNNGDKQKVLTTVAVTVISFLDKYPNACIYATGSSKARTRLYRMNIVNNLKDIVELFTIYGLKNDNWEKFVKGVDYDAFLLRRK